MTELVRLDDFNDVAGVADCDRLGLDDFNDEPREWVGEEPPEEGAT